MRYKRKQGVFIPLPRSFFNEDVGSTPQSSDLKPLVTTLIAPSKQSTNMGSKGCASTLVTLWVKAHTKTSHHEQQAFISQFD